MMRELTYSIMLLLCISQKAFCQTIIPPSPEAASLNKYSDIPVGYHTGIPNISIPLYELKEGEVSLPISLNYHASGIRVSEVASWVGLGWSLNAGGVITRSVQHAPDEGPLPGTIQTPPPPYFETGGTYHTGYYRDGFTLPPGYENVENFSADVPMPSAATYNKMMDAAQGNSDTEPDLFFFNIGGHSGKFLFKVDVDEKTKVITRTPLFIPRSDVKIDVQYGKIVIPSYTSGTELRETFIGFILTTPDGFKYHFGGVNATEYTGSEVFNITNHNQSVNVVLAPSSWYLTKIESPNGKHIDLEYVRDKFGYYDVGPEKCWTGDEYLTLNNQMIARSVVNGVKLFRISSTNEEVLFKAETVREDLSNYYNSSAGEGIDQRTSKRLDRIEVNRIDHSPVRKFLFAYNYFESPDGVFPKFLEDMRDLKSTFTTDRLRLRLNEVKETSGDETTGLPPYRFTYIDRRPLPRRISYQQDHWGYYNNESGNRGLIAFWVNPRNNNRKTNSDYSDLGTLKSIQYPTGGKTTFNYESHVAPMAEELEAPNPGRFYVADSFSASGNGSASTVKFKTMPGAQLTEPCRILDRECDRFEMQIRFRAGSPTGGIYGLNYSDIRLRTAIEIFNAADNSHVRSYEFSWLNPCEGNGPACSSNKSRYFREVIRKESIDLPTGEYYAKAYRYEGVRGDSTYLFTASVNVFIPTDRDPDYQVIPNNKLTKVGGLRIKSIVTSDGSGTSSDQERLFSYPPGGGVLFSKPQYEYQIKYLFDRPYSSIRALRGTTFQRLWASNSILPMRTTQGNHIGYAWVKEEQRGNGYKVYSYDVREHPYHFNNDPWFKGNTFNYEAEGRQYNYPVYPAPLDLERGNLLGEEIFNNDGIRVMATYHSYEPVSDIFLMRASKVDFIRAPVPEPTFYVAYTHYPIFTSTSRIKVTEVHTDYDANGLNPAKTITTYNYDSPRHLQATSITRTLDDVNYIDKFMYAPDYGKMSSSIAGIKKLQEKNVINVPVERYTTRSGSVISGTLTQFKENGPFQESTYSLNITQPIPEVSFKRSNRVEGTFIADPSYERRTMYYTYDDLGNILEASKENDVHTSYIWGHSKTRPIAEIQNAKASQVYYQSFEGLLDSFSAECKTGNKSYKGKFTFNVPSNGTFNLTYWKKTGNSSWELVQETISGVTSIGDSGTLIDDVRVFPPGARMKTYTYDPSFGITSITDENNRVSYFEYDKLGRLAVIKDDDKNILKSYTYNYAVRD